MCGVIFGQLWSLTQGYCYVSQNTYLQIIYQKGVSGRKIIIGVAIVWYKDYEIDTHGAERRIWYNDMADSGHIYHVFGGCQSK